MRRARITYKGAYHHAMNRGHEGKCIFSGNLTANLEVITGRRTKAGDMYFRIGTNRC